MSDTTDRPDALAHYQDNREAYADIRSMLHSTNQTFESADRFSQKLMLYDSTVFAVMSVQNSVEMLENCFNAYCVADNWDEVREVFYGLNYGNNKYEYCRHNYDVIFGSIGDTIVSQFTNGRVWDAVTTMVENVKGVSWVKAPFVGCMLGYTDLLCIDTNVAQSVDGLKSKGYRSKQEYQGAVGQVVSSFPDLYEMVSPFLLQWIVFDAKRENGVEYHKSWFNHVLPGSPFGRQSQLADY